MLSVFRCQRHSNTRSPSPSNLRKSPTRKGLDDSAVELSPFPPVHVCTALFEHLFVFQSIRSAYVGRWGKSWGGIITHVLPYECILLQLALLHWIAHASSAISHNRHVSCFLFKTRPCVFKTLAVRKSLVTGQLAVL